MDEPVNRYGDVQKQPPCGMADGPPSDTVTVYEPGETITVRFRETINHPSHYRISFSPNGDQDFVDPATMDELYSNQYVLLDGIPDVEDPNYAVEVTLPNVECETCVLQVIQVMYDKPPYTIPGNDLYYNCSDIALRVGGAPDEEPAPPAPDEPDEPGDDTDDEPAAPPTAAPQIGASCAAVNAPIGGGSVALLLLAAVGLFGRRRPRS